MSDDQPKTQPCDVCGEAVDEQSRRLVLLEDGTTVWRHPWHP